jgi:Ca2+-binding RTX toxin-like protein
VITVAGSGGSACTGSGTETVSCALGGGPGSAVQLELGEGDDRLRLPGAPGGLSGFVLDGGAGHDAVDFSGRSAPVRASPSSVIDEGAMQAVEEVVGGEGPDLLFSSEGSTVRGGAGDDVLGGGDGAAVLDGGPGIDTVDYGESRGDPITIDLDAGTNSDGDTSLAVEVFRGGSGDDRIAGRDGAADVLEGGSGNDRLDGRGGNDVLRGGSGFNSLIGGAGDDVLESGESDDRLVGDDDNDVLQGGGGVDQFVAGAGDDTVLAADGRSDPEDVDCGAGDDSAAADGADRLVACERVTRSGAGAPPPTSSVPVAPPLTQVKASSAPASRPAGARRTSGSCASPGCLRAAGSPSDAPAPPPVSASAARSRDGRSGSAGAARAPPPPSAGSACPSG